MEHNRKPRIKFWHIESTNTWSAAVHGVTRQLSDWTEYLAIKPVNPKGNQPNQSTLKENQSWIFIGRTGAGADTPILWPSYAKNWLIGKDPDAGKDWRQEEMGRAEDEMAGWCHWLDGHEFEQDLGAGDGQGGLACCSPWGCKELDTTNRLNWTEYLVREARIPNEERMVSSTNVAEKGRYSYTEQWNWTYMSHHVPQLTWNECKIQT